MGADCKSVVDDFEGSNPSPPTKIAKAVFCKLNIAGWSSSVARRAHNPKVVGSNPAPATHQILSDQCPDSSVGRARD